MTDKKKASKKKKAAKKKKKAPAKKPKAKKPPKGEEKKKEKPRRESMAEVLKRHDDMVQEDSIVSPDQFNIFAFPRLFTGVIDIDLLLRPTIGKRTCLIGKESVGKTLTAHIFTGAAHRTCRRCFTPIIEWVNEETWEIKERCRCGKNQRMVVIHVDVEDSFDPWWAARWGVHLEKRVYKENGYTYRKSKDDNLYVVLPKDGEAAFNFVADAIESGAADFIVFDSLAMVVPHQDLENKKGEAVSVSKERVGSRAKLVGQGLARIINAQIRARSDFRSRATVVWTNQFYAGPTKTAWENPHKPAAGIRALHAADHNMHLYYAKKESPKNPGAKMGIRHLTIEFEAAKSKAAGTPGGKGIYKVYLDDMKTRWGILSAGDTDEADRLLAYLSDLGLFEEDKKKKVYRCLGREFTKVSDLAIFLGRQDIQFIARFFIFRELLPVSALAYLEEKDYAYSPWGRDISFELFKKETDASDQESDSGPEEKEDDRGEPEEEDWDPPFGK